MSYRPNWVFWRPSGPDVLPPRAKGKPARRTGAVGEALRRRERLDAWELAGRWLVRLLAAVGVVALAVLAYRGIA